MSLRAYCYRLRRDVLFLNDEQWAELLPLLQKRTRRIMEYRKATGCSITDAREHEPHGQAALARYETLSGIRLDHPDQLWSLPQQLYGSLCPRCAKPFRTPRAKFCAECGYELPPGKQAGTLTQSEL